MAALSFQTGRDIRHPQLPFGVCVRERGRGGRERGRHREEDRKKRGRKTDLKKQDLYEFQNVLVLHNKHV